MPYRSVSPATGEVIRTFTQHTNEQVMSALHTADTAFRPWADKPFSERSKIIARAAQLMLAKKEDLARLATGETGKRIAESRFEVELSASIMQYFADIAERFVAPIQLNSDMGDTHFESSPLGVLLSIQPWNYPYWQLARFAGPHLMSGKVVLLKHAPGVPQCAVAFDSVLREAGVPKGIFAAAVKASRKSSTTDSTIGAATYGCRRIREQEACSSSEHHVACSLMASKFIFKSTH